MMRITMNMCALPISTRTSITAVCHLVIRITTNSNHNYAVSLNILNRDFTADKPNQKWVGDITYIPTDDGWLYAAIVKDLCLKKIVGYFVLSPVHHGRQSLVVKQTVE